MWKLQVVGLAVQAKNGEHFRVKTRARVFSEW